ncbi:alpha/beta fold hydrolase [Corynebacterium hadale]|uniref:alpha/beta fold hydrolase n=1 Tax=Corynebacterium hadale TaxID=2026255 RepID=UPI000BAA7931|nr:alpha/beta hydrolase [Corynebacterium hadale]PAT07376.1 alpha/beta hydrolase [Corynebacterium hadale]
MLQPLAYARTLTPAARRNLLHTRAKLHDGDGVIGLSYERTGQVLLDATRPDTSRIHWYETGPDNPAATTVVYVHGFNISAETFYKQVRGVDEQCPEVRQILIDLPGHGQNPTTDPGNLTIDRAADACAAVLRERGATGRIIVVGHSLGGPVSLSMMRRYAGEFPWSASVQISSAVEPFTVQGLPQILAGPIGRGLETAIAATPRFAEGVREIVTDTITPVLALGFYFRPMPYDIVDFHAVMIRETPLETYAGYFQDLLYHSELEAGTVLAGMPGYILVGDRDNVTPVSQSEVLHRIWPRAYMQVLPDSGHMPPLDAPGAVTTAIVRLIEGA